MAVKALAGNHTIRALTYINTHNKNQIPQNKHIKCPPAHARNTTHKHTI